MVNNEDKIPILKNKLKKNEKLYADICNIELVCKEVHKDRILLSFSDHGFEHSSRMIESLESLCKNLCNIKSGLNVYEIFVLLGAIYLHDIGIQLHQERQIAKFKDKYHLEKNIGESDEEFVRNHHHLISRYWIEDNIYDKTLRNVYYGDVILGLMIADVVESHGIDFINDKRYRDKSYKGYPIRIPLICSLVCLSDVLDCDCRRVDFERLTHVNIPVISKLHWMKHYYTNSILIKNKFIKINYSFPNVTQENQKIYQTYFSYYTKYWIERCKYQYFDLFKILDLNYEVSEEFEFSQIKVPLIEEEFEVLEENLVDIIKDNMNYFLTMIPLSFEVSIGIVKYNDMILMVERRNPEGLLTWQFPAGIVKPNYNSVEIAINEVYNETGIRAEYQGSIGKRIHPDTGVVCYYYSLNYLSGNVENRDTEENSIAMWVPINEYKEKITSNLYSKVKKYIEGE